ncbi:unnamed protein product [Microthlaspi erraticum]|uniref:Uncharacterized protein n=1 Tax=Microthlaspi erraticum TaxID=1685480 RepID=A0A6D2JD56_9BRAS|nr:unnamed protein product [Microthlaspi erraticum]
MRTRSSRSTEDLVELDSNTGKRRVQRTQRYKRNLRCLLLIQWKYQRGMETLWAIDVFWSILEHMGREEQGRTWCMDAAQLDTQRKKEEATLKTSSTTYSTIRSSSSTRPAKINSIELRSQSQTRKMLLSP